MTECAGASGIRGFLRFGGGRSLLDVRSSRRRKCLPSYCAGLSALALFVPELLVSTRLAITRNYHVRDGDDFAAEGFHQVVQRSRLIMVGLVAQYTAMPLALGISYVFDLPPELVAKLHFAGACPGGTASNVVTYLARGNVALSISMTLASTVLAPFLNPSITWLLASHQIESTCWR